MQLTSFLQDGKMTILLTGEIDHHRAKEYITAINGKIEAYLPQVCVLSFEDVTFMDSSGIAVVINTLRQISKLGGELLLTGLQTQPKKVFLTAGVDKLVRIEE